MVKYKLESLEYEVKDLGFMSNIIKAVKWVLNFSGKMKRDRVDAYSAQSAFYVIMCFIPFIMLLLTLLQYTPLNKEDLINLLMASLPKVFGEVVSDVVSSVYTTSSVFVSGTIIAAIWASGKAILAITNGLNSVFDVNETRNYIFMRVRSAFYIVLMIISLVLAMVLLVFGNQLHDVLLEHMPLLKQFSGFLINIRTIVTMILLTVLFAAMFTVLPDRKQKFFTQLPGAAATAVSWSAFSFGFSIYLNYAKNMSAIYGSLTTIVMIMLWLYSCMWLIFMGAEINCYMDDPSSF